MTFLTLSAELAQVHVILRMTGYTLPAELDFGCRLFVTSRAAEFCVRAGEREARLLAVVEFPQAPAIRGVALLAFLSEASLVNIRLFVTAHAGRIVYPEGSALVALLARHRNVQAEKRKFREIVIEVDHRLPAFGHVTFIACGA